MRNFHIITILCVILTTSFTANAQALYQIKLEEKVERSSLILEGKVIAKTSFWNAAHTMIFTSNKVEVYKVFKGNIGEHVIDVLTVGGTVGTESIEASDLAGLNVDEAGMFFCYPNTMGLKAPASDKLLWDIYSSAQGFIKYNLRNETASAPFATYDNIISKLYVAVESKTGEHFKNLNPSFKAVAPILPNNPTAPGISSFSPTSVAAGATANIALNRLTITGTNFGNAAGSASVSFDDANDGTGGTDYVVPFGDPHIVSWSNSQIVVMVPSRAGTGIIKVTDEFGVTSSSSGSLEVLYSLLTGTFTVSGTTIVAQSNLMNSNAAGGYTIYYSNSTAGSGVDFNASPIKATFQRALNTWKQINGFNILEGGTTPIQLVSGDGTNVIMFDNANTGRAPLAAGVLGTCYSYNSICTPLGLYAVRKTGFDIVIRNTGFSSGTTTFENGPCYPASADIDMESVILHELGHALNLGHINDSYQYVSGSYFNINPSKIMNYAILNGVARKNPDWSAYTGAAYAINPKGLAYGSCTAANTEMMPLSVTLEANDECPSFPTAPTPGNTLVHFDLEHATSNKFTDPQFTAVNCLGTGTGITTTAYYTFKTNTVANGTLSMQVLNYATSPANQSACSNAGVQIALYQVSACPLGQAFPAPVACRSFNADGVIANFTGLANNTSYLLLFNGLNATKSNFDLLINGNALPVTVSQFNGLVKNTYNEISWLLDVSASVKQIELESSEDGISFSTIKNYSTTQSQSRIDKVFQDFNLAVQKYYRLKFIYVTGQAEYSSVLLLKRNAVAKSIVVTPNPSVDHINILVNRESAAKLRVKLLDVNGKELYAGSYALVSGSQSIQISGLDKFPSGVYLLQLWDGIITETRKIIIK